MFTLVYEAVKKGKKNTLDIDQTAPGCIGAVM